MVSIYCWVDRVFQLLNGKAQVPCQNLLATVCIITKSLLSPDYGATLINIYFSLKILKCAYHKHSKEKLFFYYCSLTELVPLSMYTNWQFPTSKAILVTYRIIHIRESANKGAEIFQVGERYIHDLSELLSMVWSIFYLGLVQQAFVKPCQVVKCSTEMETAQ